MTGVCFNLVRSWWTACCPSSVVQPSADVVIGTKPVAVAGAASITASFRLLAAVGPGAVGVLDYRIEGR